MAPTNSHRRASAAVVGVDVTAHKEERHITDVKKAKKQSNTRMRYYVELVVGSPRESHTRIGFSGTFKALLQLHAAFEARFNAKHAPLKITHGATSRESISSATSASSASSNASASHRRRVSVLGESATELPKIVPFPTAHALLVKLQPRQHVESEAKAAARCDALFAYYSQLFNSEERELYLDYIQARAEAATGTAEPLSNQEDARADEAEHPPPLAPASAGEKRRFLHKLFGLRRHDDAASDRAAVAPRSERQRAAALDAKLEFSAPVHVAVKKHWRRP